MKTDARVRYTRQAIREAFLDLLKDKPLSKITVIEICNKAEINRGTFYKHYQDIYDLLEKVEAEGIQKFETLLTSIEVTGPHALVVTILNSLRDNSQLIQSLNLPMERQKFIQQLVECCSHHLVQILDSTPLNDCSTTKWNASFAFFIGGSSNVIHWWLQNGMPQPSEEIADYIITFSEYIREGAVGKSIIPNRNLHVNI